MSDRYGPETRALLEELQKIRVSLTGSLEPSTTQERGGVYHTQETIDKASAFTDTEIETVGFNLVQVSTDGDLGDISYKIKYLDGTRDSAGIQSVLSPHIVGHHSSIFVTNATAESGKTVYIDRYLAPWIMLSAIQHGTPSSTGGQGARMTQFNVYEVQEAAGAHTGFQTSKAETDTPVSHLSDGNFPSFFKFGRILHIRIRLNWANAVTLEAVRFWQHATAGDYESDRHKLYDTIVSYPAGLVDDDEYNIYCDIPYHLQTSTKFYFAPQWSAACGNIQGSITVKGICYMP